MNRWGRIGLLLIIAASAGMSVVARNERATAAGTLAFYGRNGTYQSAQVGILGWHGGGYGEEALDLLAGSGVTVRFRIDTFARYAYYELSYYGLEGGGTSDCKGRVYTVWWWDPGISQWKYLIRENFVHLGDSPIRNSSAGQVAPYSSYEEWIGVIASTQHQNCTYTTTHLHQSRTIGVGNIAKNGAPGFGDPGSWVGSSDVVFVAND